jgi:YjbE family integral membrane protein
MDLGDGSSWLVIPLQILLVDLLLGADNALVIALACRSLPPRDAGRAASIGICAAIALRLVMAIVATTLLAIPLVKIAGALALIVIAMNMASGAPPEVSSRGAGSSIGSAAAVIVVADAVMGLDNVMALAAIARGNLAWLTIGVALSLPVLAYGGLILMELLKRAPGLVAFGAALLGWIAGGMAISDALIASWANAEAPALVAIAPWLGAAFVFLYGRVVAKEARPDAATVPPPLRAPPAPAVRTTEPPPRRWGASVEGRVMIAGAIAIVLVAGAFLALVAYIDGAP